VRPVITAAMLDEMTPEQRQAASDAATVRDLDDLPAHLQRLAEDAREFVRQREARAAS
jgi:hypothetical protein